MGVGHEPDTAELRDIIRVEREKLGLSQEAFAERLGMSQEWTSKVERGSIRRPAIKTLRRIAALTGADLVGLLLAAGYVDTRQQSRVIAEQAAQYDSGDRREEELIDLIKKVQWDNDRYRSIRGTLLLMIEVDKGRRS